MPSEEHELLAERLPGNHALLRQLLRDACGLELSTLSPLPGSEKVRNTNLPELRSDRVVLEVDGERVMSVTVFEPQLSKDEEKRFAWPSYMAGFRAQVQVPVRVVVVAPSRAVARWAARPIVLDDGGSVVTPIVIGPDPIPRIDASGTARPRARSRLHAGRSCECGFLRSLLALPTLRFERNQRAPGEATAIVNHWQRWTTEVEWKA